jgi:hypothetical protein
MIVRISLLTLSPRQSPFSADYLCNGSDRMAGLVALYRRQNSMTFGLSAELGAVTVSKNSRRSTFAFWAVELRR